MLKCFGRPYRAGGVAYTGVMDDRQNHRPAASLTAGLERSVVMLLLAASLSGCAVVAVADAVVTVAATAVKVTAKAVGATVDAVLPDKKPD